ncbi:MAG: glycosyltransferase family 1 protein [Protaetiibacter sp.]
MVRLLDDIRLAGILSIEPERPDNPSDPVGQLKATASWRVTAPLRRAKMVHSELRPEVASRGAALRARLLVVAPHLVGADDLASHSTLDILERLAAAVTGVGDDASLWLLLSASAGAFPEEGEFQALRRELVWARGTDVTRIVLDHAVALMDRAHTHYRAIDVCTDGIVVDVDYCATHGFTSGVQRVVREVLRRWRERDGLRLIAWDEVGLAMRDLDDDEIERVTAWHRGHARVISMRGAQAVGTTVIPWRSTVLLPEVANERYARPLAALAARSGNRVVAIGYDTIPATDGFFVSREQSQSFARYLTVIKNVDEIIAISEAAAEEFAGFAQAVAAQGLGGPAIEVLPLPEEVPGDGSAPSRPTALPLVLAVGSHEMRKNHVVIADAAEILWREGLEFILLFAGGSGPEWYSDLDDRVTELVLAGRTIAIVEGISDDELAEAYAAARVQVFVSLHEGFGLPVVESLAAGTPVITSNRGSLAEIAAAGGCVVVDPDSVGEIADALRRLLTDDAERDRLRLEIAKRPQRSWDDYARTLWQIIERGAR